MLLIYILNTSPCSKIACGGHETRNVTVVKSHLPPAEKVQPQVLRCGKGLAVCLQASNVAVGTWGRRLYGDAPLE